MIRAALLALLLAAPYRVELESWRAARAESVRSEQGWLSVAGLFWLREGPNSFGSDPSNLIVLPASAPPRAGVFELRGGKVTAGNRELKPNSTDVLEYGPLRLSVIERGGRIGVRLRDRENAARREFTGLRWFLPGEQWRIRARFVAEPRKLPVANVLGQTQPMDSPGYAVFSLEGREFRLYPVLEAPGSDELFFIFRDLTAGKETYGAGRFLYSGLPQGGSVDLDFNRAVNPPCAYTPYATCPLPPKENRLAARIPAGEMTYGSH